MTSPIQTVADLGTQLAAALGTVSSDQTTVGTDQAAVAAANATLATDQGKETTDLTAAQTILDSLIVASKAAGLAINVPA